ncbi:hypothetical protein Closa_3853 [[Clostridium] saccharolyticum WM1]|uniref:Uncharacterized protein n=2 Tax=Lacrimispora TaxID=2719231 RepID=D9R0D5_LACSW|nr:hypothetical protein Closa_3853 [[Clostridium] saccharolyticum WM1]
MYIGKLNGPMPALNINAINRTVAKQEEVLYGKKKEKENEDKVTISPIGKKQSMIELLMKQKDLLREQKQTMMDSAAETGIDIASQLKEYQKQMDEIDSQIAELQAKQMEESESESSDGKIYDKPKTKEEAQLQQLNGISALSVEQEQVKAIYQEKGHLDGAVKVLKSEIRSGNGNIEAKSQKAAALFGRSQSVSSQVGSKLEDIQESISDVNDDTVEEILLQGEEDGDLIKQ